MARLQAPKRSKTVSIILSVLALVMLAVVAFAVFQPLKVLPRIRPLPPWTLTESRDQTLSSLDLAEHTLLIGFLATRDEAAPQRLADLAEFMSQPNPPWLLEGNQDALNLQVAFISVDPEHDQPEILSAFTDSHAFIDDSWLFFTGSSLSVKIVVGGGLEVFYGPVAHAAAPDDPPAYEPVLVLLDRTGMIRGRYQADPLDTERLNRDLALLAKEEASEGSARLGYEAAHLFLCYPR